PGGGTISNFGTLSSGGLGLAFDAVGNLYVAETFANQIEVIRPNGDTNLFATQLDNPRYIAIAPAADPQPSSSALIAAGLGSILAYRRLHASSRRADGADADLTQSSFKVIISNVTAAAAITSKQATTCAVMLSGE